MKNFKEKKQEIMTFLGILLFCTIILSNFSNMHYSQDTYCVVDVGFCNYARTFLYAGRPISAFVFYISGLLNLSIETHVFIGACISVVALSIAIYVLFRTISKFLKKDKSMIITLLVSFFTIINFCTMDLLVFAELAILSIGVLFSVLAACIWASDKKGKILKILLYSVIGSMCYQGILNIYVPLALIIIVAKNKKDVKKAFKEAFIALFIYGVAIILGMLVSKVLNNIFDINSRKAIIPTIGYIFKTYIKYLNILVVNTLYIGPKYWYIAVLGIITIIYFIYVIRYKYPKIYIFYYISILLSAILLPILPITMMPEGTQYMEARMCMSFGASIGIMLYFIFLTVDIEKNLIIKTAINCMVVLAFLFNCQYAIHASSEMRATNLLDRSLAKNILSKIEEYEKENNVTVKNVAVDLDKNPQYYYDGSKEYRCLNLKSLATNWAVTGVLKTYSGRDFKFVDVPEEIHKQYFEGKDWYSYNEEQLVFVDDTLIICIY